MEIVKDQSRRGWSDTAEDWIQSLGPVVCLLDPSAFTLFH